MDIKSIIDSEDHPPTCRPSVSVPAKQGVRPNQIGFPGTQAPAYDNGRDIRPPQPAPLQTSPYNDSHYPAASPHDSIRSPYQRAPSFGLNNGQYHTPHVPHQSPHHSQQVLHFPQREGSLNSGPQSGRSFGQSTPLSQTPTASTPGSASVYSNFPRPTSSHSIPTPNSVHNASGFPRESPQPPYNQPRTSSQPQSTQRHISQPATPLGPPPTYGRPSLNPHQGSPGEHHHRRSFSGGHHSPQDFVGPPATPGKSPSVYREPQPSMQSYHQLHEREQSLSVSPKTRVPSLPSIDRMDSMEAPPNPDLGWNAQATSVKRKADGDFADYEGSHKAKMTRKPSRSVGVSGLLNAEPPGESVYSSTQVKRELSNSSQSELRFTGNGDPKQSLQPQKSMSPDRPSQLPRATSDQHFTALSQYTTSTASDGATPNPVSHPQTPSGMVSAFKSAALKTSSGLIDAPLPQAKKTSRPSKKIKRPPPELTDSEVVEIDGPSLSEPANKRPRIEEPQNNDNAVSSQIAQPPTQPKTRKPPRITNWQDVPIFAQSIRGPQRTKQLFEDNCAGISRSHPATTPAPRATPSTPGNQTNGTTRTRPQVPAQSSAPNGIPLANGQPLIPSDGPLGPWEYSVTDTIPADEVTRIVADFLFPLVVQNEDAGVAPAGGGRGLGAVLEIEAKIGRLMDKNTNDRLRLPVMNECVINHADPNMRISFESSMTEVSLSALFPAISH